MSLDTGGYCKETKGPLSATTGAEVTLHVYDVSESPVIVGLNKFLRLTGSGAYHAAVEVYGTEWSFGCTEDDGTGVFGCPPKGCTVHSYRESIPLGRTKLPDVQVEDLLDELSDTWQGLEYDLLKKNCCHFSEYMAQRLGVEPVPKWVLRLAGAGAAIDDSLQKGKQIRNADEDDGYRFGDLTRGTLELIKTRGKAARGAPPTGSAHFGDFYRGLVGPGTPQPGVVWIDVKIKAFDHLRKERSIDFRGFVDDDKSNGYEGPSQWLEHIDQRLKDDDRRVKVVICNKRHLEHIAEVRKLCETVKLLPPKFIVVTRKPEGDDVEVPKIEGADFVTFDWAEAAKLTLEVIKSSGAQS